MTTVADALEQIRYRLVDPNGDNWSNRELLSYLNDAHYALSELVAEWRPELRTKTSIGFLPESSIISLDSPFERILQVSLMDRRLSLSEWIIDDRKSIKVIDAKQGTPYMLNYIQSPEPLTLDSDISWLASDLPYLYEYVVIRAQLRDEADISMETQLLGTWNGKIIARLSRMCPNTGNVNGYWE